MSAGGSIGMVLDRALNMDLLDVALRVATEHGEAADARQLLTVALRDFVTPQEAENKTRKVLTRVWLLPPTNAQAMIRWGINHQDEMADRRALHFGALLATFPFVGSIAAAVGRQIHIDGAADRKSLRAFARATFGEREFIDAGASKSLATMRNLGLLDGPQDGPYQVADRLAVPPAFSSWFLHALALTRQTESVRVAELSRAFELTGVAVEPTTSTYSLLDFHAENGSIVAVVRESVG
ncbi:MAG: hypothetical protein M0Z69_03640 [Actinomycetota bacterium]|nr:hypothetical protein [Actinomycetota bacterium]